jgi:hypothetical protein
MQLSIKLSVFRLLLTLAHLQLTALFMRIDYLTFSFVFEGADRRLRLHNVAFIMLCDAVYGYYVTRDSLILNKELFNDTEMKDAIKYLVNSIGSLKTTEGHLIPSMNNIQTEELLRVLKLFFSGKELEKLRTLLMKELKLLPEFF